MASLREGQRNTSRIPPEGVSDSARGVGANSGAMNRPGQGESGAGFRASPASMGGNDGELEANHDEDATATSSSSNILGRSAGVGLLNVSQQDVAWNPRPENFTTSAQRTVDDFKREQATRIKRDIDDFKREQATKIERDVTQLLQQILTIHQAEEQRRAEEQKQAELGWRRRAESLHEAYAEEIRKISGRHNDYVDLLRNRIKDLEAGNTHHHLQEQPGLTDTMPGQKRQADLSFTEPPVTRMRTELVQSGFHQGRRAAVDELGGPYNLFKGQHQPSNVIPQAHQTESGKKFDQEVIDLSATPLSSVSEFSDQRTAEESLRHNQGTDFEIRGGEERGEHGENEDDEDDEDDEEDEDYQDTSETTNEKNSGSEFVGYQGHNQSRPQSLATLARGYALDRQSRNSRNGQLSRSQAMVRAHQSKASKNSIPPGAMVGLPVVAKTTGLPIKILALDDTGKYRWRKGETPKQLSKELEKAIFLFIGDDKRRNLNFQRWMRNPRDCALTFTITNGKTVSIFDQTFMACNACTKLRRPCVVMLNTQGEQQLGFLRAHDDLRNGSVEDVTFYMPSRSD